MKSTNLFPLFSLNETFITRTPLLNGCGHLKSTWNGHFYCCQPVLNRHTTRHARHRKCERLLRIASDKFFVFYIKKRDLTNLFDYFLSTLLFSISFFFFFIELVSLVWFLQIWVANVYGTMIKLVHFDKEIHVNVYRNSLWDYSKCFHCSFEWYLTPHMTFFIKTCIRQTPSIKRTLQHSPRVSA